jgi:nifR3 family TIM-barrel protein
VQLFGSSPDVMYRAACLLAPLHPEALDINAGCPVPKVIKSGAGSALMKDSALLGRIVEALVRASQEKLGGIPVTVKIRSGWDNATLNYRECAEAAVQSGAAAVTLHARTRTQQYSGKSDWSHIADLVSCLDVPVFGSGDLFSPEDAENMLKQTGCAAVMFARGAMGNPFIFATAKSLLCTGSYTAPGPETRIKIGFRQLLLLAADMGEAAACREMRKQFCAYTKSPYGQPGIYGGAALRDALVHAETIEAYRSLFQAAGIL